MPSASERTATTVTNGVRNSVRSATLIFRMTYLGDGERSSSGHHASTVAQGSRFASITEQYLRGCTKNDGGKRFHGPLAAVRLVLRYAAAVARSRGFLIR